MKRFRKTKRQRNKERLDKQEAAALIRKIEKRIATASHTKHPVTPEAKRVYVPAKSYRPDAGERKIPSRNNGVEPVRKPNVLVKYTDDMAVREAEAQVEVERKKKRIAPMYNKGAYQYVTDGTDPKDIGRKNPN